MKAMKIGAAGERVVASVLSLAGIAVRVNDSAKHSDMLGWDLEAILPGGPCVKIEVKNDILASVTGNIAIEYWNTRKNKPSGLSSTVADIWAVVVNGSEVWVAGVSVLRDYVKRNKPKKDITNGGDGNAALKIYDKEEIFSSIFTRLDNCQPEQVVSHIISF